MISAIALVDCNAFYASCEQAFNPKLRGKPVVVLSNNDGCIIARNREAKAVGVPMGEPFFKAKPLIRKHDIHVYSSNYTLYGDMSKRVMATLHLLSPEVEVYSVDEAFLTLQASSMAQLEAIAHNLVKTVWQHVGIPVSVGLAPTKVLAKIANHKAKKDLSLQSVCTLMTEDQIERALQDFPLSDVWGIGRRLNQTWKKYGVTTAGQFRQLPESVVRKVMTVQGHRMIKELKGIACYSLKDGKDPRKSINATRSFGQVVTDRATLQEALCNHVDRACQKLRKQKSVAQYLSIFICNGRHGRDQPFTYSDLFHFDPGTADSGKMMKAVAYLLARIYRPGKRYKKCGVYLWGLHPANSVQTHLFVAHDNAKNQTLMQVMDSINAKQGRGTVKLAACGTYDANWSMQSQHRSPCYTTRWSELLTVR
jgi:DNA polymerase V